MAGLPTDGVDKQGFIRLTASELEMKPTLNKSQELESSYAHQSPIVIHAALS